MNEAGARQLTIDGVDIHDGAGCYVIAEIGHNHQGDLEQAKQLIDAAKECGVNAVKLQKRSNRTLYTREFYEQPYDNEFSFGQTYFSQILGCRPSSWHRVTSAIRRCCDTWRSSASR